MGAITKRRIVRVLAAAKEHRSRLLRFVLFWQEACSGMGAIAKWLVGALATATPEVGFARFNFGSVRCLLCDSG